MDERGTHAANFVRGDGRAHATATQRHSAFHLSRGDGFGQRDDEVRIGQGHRRCHGVRFASVLLEWNLGRPNDRRFTRSHRIAK